METLTPVRLPSYIKERVYSYARNHNLLWRGKPNVSAAIREVIKKGLDAEQASGREAPQMQARVQEDALTKEREILRLLNRGLEPWKVAEKIGNIELVDKCYRKMGEWMQVGQLKAENQRLMLEKQALKSENYDLRVEFECSTLLNIALTIHDKAPAMFKLLSSITYQCHMNRTLPSKIIENMFGAPLSKFIDSAHREINSKQRPA
jgi:hypothetical protein